MRGGNTPSACFRSSRDEKRRLETRREETTRDESSRDDSRRLNTYQFHGMSIPLRCHSPPHHIRHQPLQQSYILFRAIPLVPHRSIARQRWNAHMQDAPRCVLNVLDVLDVPNVLNVLDDTTPKYHQETTRMMHWDRVYHPMTPRGDPHHDDDDGDGDDGQQQQQQRRTDRLESVSSGSQRETKTCSPPCSVSVSYSGCFPGSHPRLHFASTCDV